jgi:hypothetical protein
MPSGPLKVKVKVKVMFDLVGMMLRRLDATGPTYALIIPVYFVHLYLYIVVQLVPLSYLEELQYAHRLIVRTYDPFASPNHLVTRSRSPSNSKRPESDQKLSWNPIMLQVVSHFASTDHSDNARTMQIRI